MVDDGRGYDYYPSKKKSSSVDTPSRVCWARIWASRWVMCLRTTWNLPLFHGGTFLIQKMMTNQPSHGIVSIVSSYRYPKSNVRKKTYSAAKLLNCFKSSVSKETVPKKCSTLLQVILFVWITEHHQPYPPGNSHIPPNRKKNIIFKSGALYMLLPWSVFFFRFLVGFLVTSPEGNHSPPQLVTNQDTHRRSLQRGPLDDLHPVQPRWLPSNSSTRRKTEEGTSVTTP